MVTNSQRKRETIILEIIVVVAVIIAGFALQFFSGSFDKRFLSFPVNLLLTLIICTLLLFKRGGILKNIASGTLSVTLLAAITILGLWMGLVPGNNVKISWPFVLLYLLILINLTAILSIRIRQKFSYRQFSFLLNHLGLLLILIAAGPGVGDKERYFMTIAEGTTEWRGVPSERRGNTNFVELPIAVELISFSIEEYLPKLGVIDRESGEGFPSKKSQFFEAKVGSVNQVDKWSIAVDSFSNKPMYAPNAYVRVTDNSTGQILEGRVSCGNYFQSYKLLDLDDKLCVAMTYPEPKRYQSKVKVYTPEGVVKAGEIAVNSPLRVKSWRIYQHSYDTQKGKDSEISIVELVKDPWAILLYIGVIMMLIGSITLFWKGGKK